MSIASAGIEVFKIVFLSLAQQSIFPPGYLLLKPHTIADIKMLFDKMSFKGDNTSYRLNVKYIV